MPGPSSLSSRRWPRPRSTRSKLPAILFGAAFVLLLAAFVALAYGVAAGLATIIGPLAGGIVAFLLFAAVAGVLIWVGLNKVREEL